MELESKVAEVRSSQSRSTIGFLNLFIFTLGFLLFVFCLYLSLVFLDRQVLIQNGWSPGLMTYQAFAAGGHAVGLFILIRLLVQRRRIAIAYVKIAIVLGAIFRVVVDPLVARVVDPGVQVPTFRVWERVVFGVVMPFCWFQYFRKSEEVRLALVK